VSAVPEAPKEQDSAEAPGRLTAFVEDLSYWPAVGGIVRVCRSRREQLTYLIVGGWNTLLGYLIWALFQYLLHDYLYYLVILVLAWLPAVVNAYLGYRIFVFRSKGKIWRELPRFALVYVGTLITGLIALPILLHVLPFSIYVTQGLYTVVVVGCSYVAHKFFSFGGGHSRSAAAFGDPDGSGQKDVPPAERT
jgi:putative flippase GtrA